MPHRRDYERSYKTKHSSPDIGEDYRKDSVIHLCKWLDYEMGLTWVLWSWNTYRRYFSWDSLYWQTRHRNLLEEATLNFLGCRPNFYYWLEYDNRTKTKWQQYSSYCNSGQARSYICDSMSGLAYKAAIVFALTSSIWLGRSINDVFRPAPTSREENELLHAKGFN